MNKRNYLLILLSLILIVSLTGVLFAADTVDTAKYKKPAPWTIGFSNASSSNSWRVSFVEHIRFGLDQAKKQGLIKQWYETNANDDPTKQIADIEDLLTKKPDLLIVSASTSEALTPEVEKAMKQGVPVVLVDRTISSDNYVAFIEGSHYEMGLKQAQWLADTLHGKGNIVMIGGLAGASPAEDRIKAAKSVWAKYPGIKVLDLQYSGWSPVEGKRIMETFLTKYKQIDGVWCDGLEAAGAVEAFLDAHMKVPPITCEDYNRFLKQWKTNNLTAIGVSNSVRVGYEVIQIAIKVLQGQPVPHHAVIPNVVITKDNLDKFVRMDLPDDYWAASMPEVAARLFPNAKK